MNDTIVDEVRRIRDAHGARFNYDLEAIFRDIKEQEKNSGRKFVSFPPRKVETKQTVLPVPAAAGAAQSSAPSNVA
jgi:hypothetical protein